MDTSIIVPWLREHYDARIVCVAGDIGQGDELEGVREKAIASGADECYIEDLRHEFVSEFIWPTLRAGAVYGRKYLLGTSMGRPLLARRQVEVARRIGADALAHGCTGKGNDQVRFELTYARFCATCRLSALCARMGLRSRGGRARVCEEAQRPVTASAKRIIHLFPPQHLAHIAEWWGARGSRRRHRLISSAHHLAGACARGSPRSDDRASVRVHPVAVDGTFLDPIAILTALNEIGGRHGVGRIDLVEDRLVGMKSRGVYETPGGTLLYVAHSELEQLILDRRTLAAKDSIAPRYADLVYEGRWWTTEREAYDAFVNVTQERVTGGVTLRLYKGMVTIVSRASEYALYDERFVTFGEDDVYKQSDAGGFIRLYSLPSRVRALRDQELAARAVAPVSKHEETPVLAASWQD